jgi:hypothetical protein
MKMIVHTMHGGSDAQIHEDDKPSEVKRKLKDIVLEKLQQYLCDSWHCPPCWDIVRKIVGFIVLDPFVDLFITLCIVVNTLFLALDHYGMDKEFERALKNGNYVSALFFRQCTIFHFK